MLNSTTKTFVAALLAAMAGPAFAADLYEPPVVEEAPPIVSEAPDFGGWYIRGDVDYHWSKFRGGDYITYGVDDCDPCGPLPVPGTNSLDSGKLKGAFSFGGGVGYKVNQYFRTDLTADWLSKSKFTGHTTGTCGTGDPCVSTDKSSYSALLLLANAYVDLGTWHRITPYVGAGIGGAWLKWDTLNNTDDDGEFHHKGAKGWRFAYSLSAGASYCLTRNVDLDLGYRFSHINGGRMFQEHSTSGDSLGAGPGFDKGINIHEVRGGLRYSFGGTNECAEPETVAYEPEPEPIYTK